MRKTIIAVLAAVAAIFLVFLTAAPASAEPGDITTAFTTTPNPGGSNTVTGTFTATGSNLPYYCTMIDLGSLDAETGIQILRATSIEEPAPSMTVSDTDVPDGTYTIDWYCSVLPGGHDGTKNYEDVPGFGASTMLVVPAVVPEEPEAPSCTGSVCLPTGSAFGF